MMMMMMILPRRAQVALAGADPARAFSRDRGEVSATGGRCRGAKQISSCPALSPSLPLTPQAEVCGSKLARDQRQICPSRPPD